MKKKIGVVLAGCGNKDGSEIHESTLTLLNIDLNDAEAVPISFNENQKNVINYLTNTPVSETRNMLLESARIARGNIRNIDEINPEEIDALVIPGGLGVVINLSDWLLDNPKTTAVNEKLERLIRVMHEKNKPIGAICIAPVLVAKVLGPDFKVKVTVGTNEGIANNIMAFGAEHVPCNNATDVVIDRENKVVTTPAYMLATRISEVNTGISKLIKELIKLIPKIN